jgi:SAM-dependent methyltransferase
MSQKKFPNSYFKDRFNCNNLRLRQFKIDKLLIQKFIKNGKICDVGCSTGEFLYNIGWKKHVYGMEINKYAKKEARKFINFKKNITNQKNYFDIVVFRGTIQHLDDPFNFLKKSYASLKKGGWLILLSVPNANSILFKIKKTLPVLYKEDKRIYYIPRDNELLNVLKNYNFKIKKIEYPYLNTPYKNLMLDHIKFLLNIFFFKFYPHAFWMSSMNIVARK